jgi:hypothetical protein
VSKVKRGLSVAGSNRWRCVWECKQKIKADRPEASDPPRRHVLEAQGPLVPCRPLRYLRRAHYCPRRKGGNPRIVNEGATENNRSLAWA